MVESTSSERLRSPIRRASSLLCTIASWFSSRIRSAAALAREKPGSISAKYRRRSALSSWSVRYRACLARYSSQAARSACVASPSPGSVMLCSCTESSSLNFPMFAAAWASAFSGCPAARKSAALSTRSSASFIR